MTRSPRYQLKLLLKKNALSIGFLCGFMVFIFFVSLVSPVHVIDAVIGLVLGCFMGCLVWLRLKLMIVPKAPHSRRRAKKAKSQPRPDRTASMSAKAAEHETSNKPQGNGDSSRVNDHERRPNWPLPDENLMMYRLRIIARNDDLFNEALRRVKESFKKIEDNVKFKYAKETELCCGAMGMWTMHYLRSTGRSVGLLDQKLMEWLVHRARRRGGHAFSSMLRDLGSKQA